MAQVCRQQQPLQGPRSNRSHYRRSPCHQPPPSVYMLPAHASDKRAACAASDGGSSFGAQNAWAVAVQRMTVCTEVCAAFCRRLPHRAAMNCCAFRITRNGSCGDASGLDGTSLLIERGMHTMPILRVEVTFVICCADRQGSGANNQNSALTEVRQACVAKRASRRPLPTLCSALQCCSVVSGARAAQTQESFASLCSNRVGHQQRQHLTAHFSFGRSGV